MSTTSLIFDFAQLLLARRPALTLLLLSLLLYVLAATIRGMQRRMPVHAQEAPATLSKASGGSYE